MLLKRLGLPEEKELVLCKVTNVQYHCVMVLIEEYEKEGMIHISEVSPGRIRNINDFVKVGKQIVCMVLKIDPKKNHIDLSLRRVNDNQKRKKMNTLKLEQAAEKIIESLAEDMKIDVNKLYKQITDVIFKEYDWLHECFEDVVESNIDVLKLGLPKELAEPLTTLVKQRIKPKEVHIGGLLSLELYTANGVDTIRDVLVKAKKIDKHIEIKYAGAGKYMINVMAKEFKDAESILKSILDCVSLPVQKENGVFKFDRIEIKS